MSFVEFKRELVARAREFTKGSGKCRELIAINMSDFIQDGSVRNRRISFAQSDFG